MAWYWLLCCCSIPMKSLVLYSWGLLVLWLGLSWIKSIIPKLFLPLSNLPKLLNPDVGDCCLFVLLDLLTKTTALSDSSVTIRGVRFLGVMGYCILKLQSYGVDWGSLLYLGAGNSSMDNSLMNPEYLSRSIADLNILPSKHSEISSDFFISSYKSLSFRLSFGFFLSSVDFLMKPSIIFSAWPSLLSLTLASYPFNLSSNSLYAFTPSSTTFSTSFTILPYHPSKSNSILVTAFSISLIWDL